jgi:hypothetical protein
LLRLQRCESHGCDERAHINSKAPKERFASSPHADERDVHARRDRQHGREPVDVVDAVNHGCTTKIASAPFTANVTQGRASNPARFQRLPGSGVDK